MNTFISFIKKEAVFCIAFICAVISAFFVPPSKEYLSYIDWNTLGILFALMGVVAGLRKCGVFSALGTVLCRMVHTTRGLCTVLVALCFFCSMLITNDVALLTFIPFTIALLTTTAPAWVIMYTVVLQTIAANTGSMLTPVGNPQNLFLFSVMKENIFHFLGTMLPYTLESAILLAIGMLVIPNTKLPTHLKQMPLARHEEESKRKLHIAIYAGLFILSLLSVIHIIPKIAVAAAVLIVLFIIDRQVLKSIDYMLLLTFTAFFIFTGNIANISRIKNFLETAVQGKEFFAGVIASQVISNVPATLLLYPFSSNARELLIGVNAGGLGTLIASLASLISYKIYSRSVNADSTKYMLVFTAANVIGLAAAILLHFILNM